MTAFIFAGKSGKVFLYHLRFAAAPRHEVGGGEYQEGRRCGCGRHYRPAGPLKQLAEVVGAAYEAEQAALRHFITGFARFPEVSEDPVRMHVYYKARRKDHQAGCDTEV